MATDDEETAKETLFSVAMKGKWKEVLKICEQDVGALKLKITKSGATALHIAVAESQVYAVRELLKIAEKSEYKNELVRIQNNEGYTALHLAASMGNIVMCSDIANADDNLLSVRNNNGETPLFLAALFGKNKAFYNLHSLCGTERGYYYSRRGDGDTFLHCAIDGEHMGLAFQIIQMYPKLVHSVNVKGRTPLHVLATKPAAFASGINRNLGRFRRFVYDRCISVKKQESPGEEGTTESNSEEEGKVSKDIENPEKSPKHAVYNHCIYANPLESSEEEDITNTPNQGTDGITKSNSQKGEGSNDIKNPETSSQHDVVLGRQFLPYFGFCNWSHQRQHKNSWVCDFISHLFELASTLGTKYTMIKSVTEDMREAKIKHMWSIEIMKALIKGPSIYDYLDPAGPNRNQEEPMDRDTDNPQEVIIKADEEEGMKGLLTSRGIVGSETAMLVAAKNGITEIVEAILEKFPVAIHDRDASNKNLAILAVENRHVSLFNVLIKKNLLRESIVRQTDVLGNSALHAAAFYAEDKLWPIPGDAAQMQWEIKWFKYVKSSLPTISFRRNNEDKTPEEIFTKSHRKLVKRGANWLVKTSESCSVVAALIAAVAFATSASIPGGIDESSGKPKLEKETAFEVFAISSLIALCFSVTSLTMFLGILTSRFQERDFAKDLPTKLLVGLTSLFISIGSMLVSFSSGHSLVTEDKLRYAVFPVYTVACLPISIFAIAQFPLYFDIIRTNFKSRFAYQE